MGTNYYVAANHCECCDRYDKEYHIGKSSGGWAFSFRGYRPERLVSWRQWREFLKDRIIMDEYGERIDYDWFVQYIEGAKSPNYINESGRKNLVHNEEGRKPNMLYKSNKHGYPWFDPEYDWDDEDGYSFSAREFS